MNIKLIYTYFLVFIGSILLSASLLYVFIKPTYEATAIIYPPSTHNPEFLLTGGLKFGDEKELNEHIELLQSSQVFKRLILSFNLQKHYSMEETDSSLQKTVKTLHQNVEIKRSTYRSLHVSVFDKNPQIAADLSNALVKEADAQLSELVKLSITKDLVVVEKIYQNKQAEVQKLKDSLAILEKNGERQVFGEVTIKSPRYRITENLFEAECASMIDLKHQVEKLSNTMQKNIPQSYVISAATKPLKPAKPNVVLISLCVGVISVFVLFILTNKNAIRKLA